MDESGSRPSFERGYGTRLAKQLIELRTRGMNNPEIGDLPELRQLAEYLIPDAAVEVGGGEECRYWDGNEDETVRRIEVLLECIIDGYDDPDDPFKDPRFSRVVRLWYGLDPSTRKLGQKERHEQARQALDREVEPGTFKNSYARKFKEQLASRLTTRYEKKRPFTLSQATRSKSRRAISQQPESVKPEQASTPKAVADRSLNRENARLLIGVPALSVLIIGAILFFISLNRSGPSHRDNRAPSSIPPKGTVISATTAEVAVDPALQPPEGPVHLVSMRPIIRACNLTEEWPCRFHAAHVKAKDGDAIKFLLILESEGRIPYARLNMRFGAVHEVDLRATEQISWPGGHTVENDGLIISTNDFTPTLHYVSKSTDLRLASTKRLGWLPDGIARPTGIALTDIGPPASCFFNCIRRFTRLIEFKGIIKLAPYLGSQPEEFTLHN